MELEKRKRRDDEESNGKRGKHLEDDGGMSRVALSPPGDEEVDEFFAILKRIKEAVKYFQRRNGVSCANGALAAKPPWNPSFEREDFDGVRKEGLDLNSDPASDG